MPPTHEDEVAAEAQAIAHGSGRMGSRPSQAIFLGNLALVLLGLMLASTAFVLLSALAYGG